MSLSYLQFRELSSVSSHTLNSVTSVIYLLPFAVGDDHALLGMTHNFLQRSNISLDLIVLGLQMADALLLVVQTLLELLGLFVIGRHDCAC